MKECTKVVEAAKEKLLERWSKVYKLSILKQGKWFNANHTLIIGDIVLITDLMMKLNYYKIGRITKVEKDIMGVERYYIVEYKKNKRVFSTVKRTAQSLCVVMRKDEQEGPVIDPILFLNEADLASASKKQKVIVKLVKKESAILDIGSAKGTECNDIGRYR